MQQIYIESCFKGFRRFYDLAHTVNHPPIGIIEKKGEKKKKSFTRDNPVYLKL